MSQVNTDENKAYGGLLANDTQRYLLQKVFANEKIFNTVTIANQQYYALPFNCSILETLNITVGQLKYTPVQIHSREEWDTLNMLPYVADIPSYYFVYGNKIGIFPIPASDDFVLTYNFKARIPDLSIEDVTKTLSATNGSITITGTGLTASTSDNEFRWVKIPFTSGGDDQWYQIESMTTTTITLYSPYNGNTVAGATGCTIGQMPIIAEDFHDMMLHRPLAIYFNTIRPDATRGAFFKGLYDEEFKELKNYSGKKTMNVNLRQRPNIINPNLFIYKAN